MPDKTRTSVSLLSGGTSYSIAARNAEQGEAMHESIAFVLVENFSLIAFSAAIEPLRLANRLSEKPLFHWGVYSVDGEPAQASNGVSFLCDGSVEDISGYDRIFLISGLDVHKLDHSRLINWLRRVNRQGVKLGGLCTATYILARAGFLDDHVCTIHWENYPALVESFPKVLASTDIFRIDRNIATCSGGTAPMDLMLHIISGHVGSELAEAIADQFLHERIRDSRDLQKGASSTRIGIRHPKLLPVIEKMKENLEEPLSRAELAREVGLSTRQLERLFRKFLDRSPARFYLEIRLKRARLLLLQTHLSIIDIALACGFISASHFSKCYRDFFGHTPRVERNLDKVG